MARMATPPTMHELLDDEIYRAYVKRSPRTTVTVLGETKPHPGLTIGDPWQVWARTAEGKWRTGKFPTYRDAWQTTIKAYRNPDVADVALVSRRVFFGPPGHWEKYKVRNPRTNVIEWRERWVVDYHWDAGLEWCPRCRRPSAFRNLHATHHALKRQPTLTEDDAFRCVFCGIRRVAFPDPYTLVGD